MRHGGWASNPRAGGGSTPHDLVRVASGGEIGRVQEGHVDLPSAATVGVATKASSSEPEMTCGFDHVLTRVMGHEL